MARACGQIRGGFTLMELSFGMVVTALVVGAVAVFMGAMSKTWQESAASQSSGVTIERAANQVDELFRRAEYIGWAGQRTASSDYGAILWREDENKDGKMQLSEISLLYFDSTGKRLILVYVPTDASNAGAVCDSGDIDDEGDLTTFARIATARSSQVLKNVTNVKLVKTAASDTLSRGTIEYWVKTVNGGREAAAYRTCAVRSQVKRPVKCSSVDDCRCCESSTCNCAASTSCACTGSMACRLSTTAKCRPGGSFGADGSTTASQTQTSDSGSLLTIKVNLLGVEASASVGN